MRAPSNPSPSKDLPAASAAGVGLLPEGFRVALDRGARWVGDGDGLVGGSPIRLLRLTSSGRQIVERLAAGAPVPLSPGAQRLARRLLDAGLAHPRPPVPVPPPAVAIVIPVRDDAGGLAATLAALGENGAAEGETAAAEAGCLHVVVVDDASADPGAVKAAGSRPGITVVHQAVQGGPAAARNEGWRATGEPFVAFVDANCEPKADWLEVLLPHFADPQVAAVAPRIVSGADPGVARWLADYEAVCSPLDLGANEAVVRPRSPVAYVPTAAVVVRRAALEELGGFDETLTVGEDVDFVWRLAAAGWTVRYEPRATVRHPTRPHWPAWLRQRYRYGTSAAPLARRHGSAVAPAVVSPWTATAWALAAGGHPLVGVAAAAGSAALAAGRFPLRTRGHLPRTATGLLPGPEAARLAGLGHLSGGLALARAVRRTWPPLAVTLALASKRSRPALAAAVIVPGLVDWLQGRPRLGPVRFVALRLGDDLAYAAGVWAGCARERSLRALRPDLRIARRSGARQTGNPVASIGGTR